MNLSVAQFTPFPGAVDKNIARHCEIIKVAISNNVDLIVFPELSITGYEPTLAKELALDVDDKRLEVFQEISDRGGITVAIGAPTKSLKGIHISLIFFQPGQPMAVYSKHYLHPDEDPFFVPGENLKAITIKGTKIAFAICYEISIAAHTTDALGTGVVVFIASVAKSLNGVTTAMAQLETTAKKYGVPVLMSNAIGPSDGGVCGGGSLVLDAKGKCLAQLDSTTEAILIFDGFNVQKRPC